MPDFEEIYSVIFFSDEVGSNKDLLVSFMEIRPNKCSLPVPCIMITNNVGTGNQPSLLYGACVANLAQKYKAKGIQVFGIVLDSAKVNLEMVRRINLTPFHACTLSTGLGALRQLDALKGTIQIGEDFVQILDWDKLYSTYKEDLKCPTSFNYKCVDKFLELLPLNMNGSQQNKTVCAELFQAMRDSFTFYCKLVEITEHVTVTTAKMMAAIGKIDTNKWEKLLVFKYTSLMSYKFCKLNGCSTVAMTNYNLECFYKDNNNKDRESLIKLCTELNPQFKFLTDHKDAATKTPMESAAAQINQQYGWESNNLEKIFSFIFTTIEGSTSKLCIFCNDISFNIVQHLSEKHDMKFPELQNQN